MAIHLVQRSRAYRACLESSATDDVIVLTGEGVMAAIFRQEDVAMRCYATKSDLHERAIDGRIGDFITPISDEALVELCATHSPVVTWTQP